MLSGRSRTGRPGSRAAADGGSDGSSGPQTIRRGLSFGGFLGRGKRADGNVNSMSPAWMRARIRKVHTIEATDHASLLRVVKAAFAAADEDASGSLTEQEFVAVLSSLLNAQFEASDGASTVSTAPTPSRGFLSRRGRPFVTEKVRQKLLVSRVVPVRRPEAASPVSARLPNPSERRPRPS